MSWTKVSKASGTSYTKVPKATIGGTTTINPGNPIGLLLALTYATSSTVNTGGWKPVSKASGTSWTKIAKAT